MKFYISLSVLVATVVVVQCTHTFMGSNVFRQQVFNREVRYSGNTFTKRIEYLNYTLPATVPQGRTIQGLLAYDLINKGGSANVTAGGIGFRHVSLRMKSPVRNDIRYDVYIYV